MVWFLVCFSLQNNTFTKHTPANHVHREHYKYTYQLNIISNRMQLWLKNKNRNKKARTFIKNTNNPFYNMKYIFFQVKRRKHISVFEFKEYQLRGLNDCVAMK